MEVITINIFVTILYVLLAFVIFGVLVFFHELGHFLAARACGVRVNEFALGMGPTILKKQGKRTLYALRLLPIGGFCAMDGEDGEGSDSVSEKPYVEGEAPFYEKPAWQRIVILAAGAAMNLLLGFIVLVIFYAPMETFPSTVIDSFMEGYSYEAQLQTGDEILKINEYSIFYNTDIGTFLQHDDGAPYDIVVQRDGEVLTLEDQPLERRPFEVEVRYDDGTTGFEERMYYGLVFEQMELTLGGKLKLAAINGVDFVRMVWIAIVDLIGGKVGVGEMSGPIGIGGMIVETARTSMPALWLIAALITINLGVMNLMPIPALDGGRILFILVDRVVKLIRGKGINPKYENAVHFAGFALLMVLIAFVSFNDIMKFFQD